MYSVGRELAGQPRQLGRRSLDEHADLRPGRLHRCDRADVSDVRDEAVGGAGGERPGGDQQRRRAGERGPGGAEPPRRQGAGAALVGEDERGRRGTRGEGGIRIRTVSQGTLERGRDLALGLSHLGEPEPLKRMVGGADVAVSKPPSTCNSVDLPEPERPMIAMRSPRCTSRSTPCSTGTGCGPW